MTGNCLGWVVYGYYKHDAFVVAANIPGLILSIWLNSGAAKLQYHELVTRQTHRATQQQQHAQDLHHWDAATSGDHGDDDNSVEESLRTTTTPSAEALVMVPQEVALLRMIVGWAIVIVWVGWFSTAADPAKIVGVIVNINLIFFYGAPLQTYVCTFYLFD
jgi:hypothetical protein